MKPDQCDTPGSHYSGLEKHNALSIPAPVLMGVSVSAIGCIGVSTLKRSAMNKYVMWVLNIANMSAKEDYDCIVIGAGVQGSFTAYQLAKKNKTTLLLEQVCHPQKYVQ